MDASDPVEAVVVGRALGGLANTSISAGRAGTAVAQGLLLGVPHTVAVGRTLREKQTRNRAQTIAGCVAWLCMWNRVVRR